MADCKCTFTQRTVGDGCDVCNPAKALEQAYDTIKDLRAERDALRMKYDCAHAELLAIHEIVCCGYANVLRHPPMPDDTITVRGVKIMAAALGAIDQLTAEQVAAALAEQKQPRPMSKGESEAIDRALACLNVGARSVTVLYTDDTPLDPTIRARGEKG